MEQSPITAAPADQLVTASDLVRHFGVWQDRAARTPVYILHRGRPRLVLTSVDVMDALCAPHAPADGAGDVDALLAAMREAVMIAGPDLRVRAVSRAAQALLGPGASPGATIARAWPSAHDFVAEAARRVAGSGIAETIEVAAPRDADRRHSVTIEPFADGVALFGRDITAEHGLADAAASATALHTAFAALGDAADVHISPRGFIDSPGPALAALTALSVEALTAARFVTLLEIGSRVAVGEALEAVMRDGDSRALDAQLLVNRAEPMAVRIALAPVLDGASIVAAAALIVRATEPLRQA